MFEDKQVVFEDKKGRQTDYGYATVMSRRGDERVLWDQQKSENRYGRLLRQYVKLKRIFQEERSRGAQPPSKSESGNLSSGLNS